MHEKLTEQKKALADDGEVWEGAWGGGRRKFRVSIVLVQEYKHWRSACLYGAGTMGWYLEVHSKPRGM